MCGTLMVRSGTNIDESRWVFWGVSDRLMTGLRTGDGAGYGWPVLADKPGQSGTLFCFSLLPKCPPASGKRGA